MKKPMNLHVKKTLLQVGGFLVSIAPLAALIGLKWGDYTHTVTRTVSLGVGGAAAIVLMLVKALGKMPQKIKPIIRYGVAFGLVCLLDPLITDLKYILGAAFVGELADVAIFEWQIAKTNQQILGRNLATGAIAAPQPSPAISSVPQVDEAEGRA